jgi:hypothetical protein
MGILRKAPPKVGHTVSMAIVIAAASAAFATIERMRCLAMGITGILPIDWIPTLVSRMWEVGLAQRLQPSRYFMIFQRSSTSLLAPNRKVRFSHY